jgi:hypothetical protein
MSSHSHEEGNLKNINSFFKKQPKIKKTQVNSFMTPTLDSSRHGNDSTYFIATFILFIGLKFQYIK